MAIGSGGNFALAAARALADTDMDAEAVARRAMQIASDGQIDYVDTSASGVCMGILTNLPGAEGEEAMMHQHHADGA